MGRKTMKPLKLFTAAALVAVTGLLPLTGCADRTVHETTTVAPGTTTTVTPVTSTSTTHVETVEDGNTSVLGTIFDVVGEVIALPFRIVAGIFRFIF
jgi:hypothetical protein